jgi:hypothetical protein
VLLRLIVGKSLGELVKPAEIRRGKSAAMNIIQGGLAKAFRSAGQSLDKFGMLLECNPHIERCMFYTISCVILE